jgi:hypothetical protein
MRMMMMMMNIHSHILHVKPEEIMKNQWSMKFIQNKEKNKNKVKTCARRKSEWVSERECERERERERERKYLFVHVWIASIIIAIVGDEKSIWNFKSV